MEPSDIRIGQKYLNDPCPGGQGQARRAFIGVMAATALGAAGSNLFAPDCGAPPPAKPNRWTGGESVPPLPLPATPLRRSEKKRPPAPPVLLGKVQYGKIMTGHRADGSTYTYRDWTTDPGDVRSIMDSVQHVLGLAYKGIDVQLPSFSWDPTEIPVLYLTGHEGFEFSNELRAKLRVYLQDGGYLIGDACCGMKDFRAAFMNEMNIIFPRRKMQPLDPDHPLWESAYKIDEVGFVGYDQKAYRGRPLLESVEIGCRASVIFSPFDLSCGWDFHRHDRGQRVWASGKGQNGPEDAIQMGINMFSYALADYQLGRQLASQKVYHDTDTNGDEKFVFGQVVHGGDWDPDPDAAGNLMKNVAASTTIDVKYKKVPVDLSQSTAFNHALLYMTGHHDFILKDAEIATLREFFRLGGVMIADACCGRLAFDGAFRREIARVLPGAKLAPLPPNHAIYTAGGHTISNVSYTPRLKAALPDLNTPCIEGITIGGATAIFYSKYDLGCGWEQIDHPYRLGYQDADALKLGTNMILYAMTH
ncbi:MAG: DUF4159 domain-containing protein [Planctomycetota bacterium]